MLLRLLKLKIARRVLERTNAIKFLGVLLDENITRTNDIHSIEMKFATNIGLLYRAKYLLDQPSLKTIYFSYIHSYPRQPLSVWCPLKGH